MQGLVIRLTQVFIEFIVSEAKQSPQLSQPGPHTRLAHLKVMLLKVIIITINLPWTAYCTDTLRTLLFAGTKFSELANCIKFANNSTRKNYSWGKSFAYLEKKILT